MRKHSLTLCIMTIFTNLSAAGNNLSPAVATLIAGNKIPDTTQQLIIVKSNSKATAEVSAWDKTDDGWINSISPFAADVGSQGISDNKKEGDNKTPAGLYALGPAFGTQPLALKMDYRYVTPADKFVDDPSSKDYNQWIYGATTAKSYEIMQRDDGIYKIGVVVNYNMHPVVKGKGSAIFMHIWYGPDIGTTGCVAMSENNMLKILKWLDKAKHPYILITN